MTLEAPKLTWSCLCDNCTELRLNEDKDHREAALQIHFSSGFHLNWSNELCCHATGSLHEGNEHCPPSPSAISTSDNALNSRFSQFIKLWPLHKLRLREKLSDDTLPYKFHHLTEAETLRILSSLTRKINKTFLAVWTRSHTLGPRSGHCYSSQSLFESNACLCFFFFVCFPSSKTAAENPWKHRKATFTL